MIDAKEYPNTIEFVAEKLYTAWLERWIQDLKDSGEAEGEAIYTSSYKERPEDEKEILRRTIIPVLNAVNYFEDKTCKDCGYFDLEKSICFGEDVEFEGHPEYTICRTFAPRCLVEVKV